MVFKTLMKEFEEDEKNRTTSHLYGLEELL
jgi:hypothetical protein